MKDFQQPRPQRPPANLAFVMGIKALGLVLFVFFLSLMGMIMYSYLFDVCKLYFLITQSETLVTALVIFGLIIGLNLLFNFLMAVFTKPGGTQHLKYMARLEALEGVSLAQENDYDSDDEIGDNSYNKGKVCLKCKSFKPLRAHHCSICNACVLRMDHHCPWISNCVGHNNHRYFLLLLFYVVVGSGFYSVMSLPIVFDLKYQSYRKEASTMFETLFLFSGVIFLCLVPFSAWNWYLAMSGQTAIEFWERRTQAKLKAMGRKELGDKICDFRQDKVTKNLEYIFGTSNVFKMFLPSVRYLEHEGVEWEKYINGEH